MTYAHGGELQECPVAENVISVSPDGGDFTTVKAALESITAPGPTNRWCIELGPGIYTEDNPLPGKQYTYIRGCGQNTTRITATNADQDLFTPANFFILDDLSLSGVSGTGWVMQLADAHAVVLRDSVIFNCVRGVRTNHASATFTSENNILLAFSPTMVCGYCNNAGNMIFRGGRVGAGSTITTVFDLDGATAITTILAFLSFESGVTTVMVADNGARTVLSSLSLVGMVDGLVLRGGSDTRGAGVFIFNAQQDGIRFDDVGSGTNYSSQSTTAEDCTRYNVNILSATAALNGYGASNVDKWNFVPGAQIYGALVDLKEDDEGLNVFGELHVGVPELGAECVFGEGDSYTRGMLVYTYNPSGPVWTDVTTEAQSASASTFTFPAIAQENAIYVASSLTGVDFLQHFGIKAAITTAVVLGGGSIVVEYWNGGAWVAINHMSTLSNSPYTQFAKDIFERTGGEQVRYPTAFLAAWTKNDPGMGLGTDYYWIRYRVATAVTTVPVFQQFKLHTNRFEVNADGVTEYFGAARYPKDLIVHIELNDAVSGSAPSNSAIAFSAATTLTLTRNQFSDNQTHSFGEVIVMPTGIDTSLPLVLEEVWYADTTNAGNVELVTFFAQLEVGDLWDGSVAESSAAKVEAVGASTRYVSRKTTFELDISELVPGELLVYRTQRDATGGNNPPDSLSGNIKFGSVRAFGTFWRP